MRRSRWEFRRFLVSETHRLLVIVLIRRTIICVYVCVDVCVFINTLSISEGHAAHLSCSISRSSSRRNRLDLFLFISLYFFHRRSIEKRNHNSIIVTDNCYRGSIDHWYLFNFLFLFCDASLRLWSAAREYWDEDGGIWTSPIRTRINDAVTGVRSRIMVCRGFSPTLSMVQCIVDWRQLQNVRISNKSSVKKGVKKRERRMKGKPWCEVERVQQRVLRLLKHRQTSGAMSSRTGRVRGNCKIIRGRRTYTHGHEEGSREMSGKLKDDDESTWTRAAPK